jgi:translation initiation factor IF-3
VVQFRGREIAHTDLGRKLLMRFTEDLATYGAAEGQPRMEGRNAHVLISPLKKDTVHPVKAGAPKDGASKDKPKPPTGPSPQ